MQGPRGGCVPCAHPHPCAVTLGGSSPRSSDLAPKLYMHTRVHTHAPCQAYTYQCTHTHSTHRHAHRLQPRAEPKDSGLQRTRNQPLCPRYLRLVSCDRPVSLCFQVP